MCCCSLHCKRRVFSASCEESSDWHITTIVPSRRKIDPEVMEFSICKRCCGDHGSRTSPGAQNSARRYLPRWFTPKATYVLDNTYSTHSICICSLARPCGCNTHRVGCKPSVILWLRLDAPSCSAHVSQLCISNNHFTRLAHIALSRTRRARSKPSQPSPQFGIGWLDF